MTVLGRIPREKREIEVEGILLEDEQVNDRLKQEEKKETKSLTCGTSMRLLVDDVIFFHLSF